MQEIFDSMAVLEDPVSEKKQVMFILASLPESFQTMVTALAASTEDVPSLSDVKEKLRSEELRQKQIGESEDSGKKALASGHSQMRNPKSRFPCHFCGRIGHFKKGLQEMGSS